MFNLNWLRRLTVLILGSLIIFLNGCGEKVDVEFEVEVETSPSIDASYSMIIPCTTSLDPDCVQEFQIPGASFSMQFTATNRSEKEKVIIKGLEFKIQTRTAEGEIVEKTFSKGPEPKQQAIMVLEPKEKKTYGLKSDGTLVDNPAEQFIYVTGLPKRATVHQVEVEFQGWRGELSKPTSNLFLINYFTVTGGR